MPSNASNQMGRHDIIIIFVLIFIVNCNSYTVKYNESIFLFGNFKSYCDLKCGNYPHTLCRDEKVAKPFPFACGDKIKVLRDSEIQDDIIMGLNGLRDRIAGIMQISNMILLKWDEELSLMAEIYLSHCTPFTQNPCTNLGEPEAHHHEPRYYHVTGNVLFRKNMFFPFHFVPSAMRDWYYEKNTMRPPTIRKSEFGDLYGELDGHNNFTHLANPRLSRVGCAIAGFHEGYSILCYFFPYFQRNVQFSLGTPATNCPNLFPLKGVLFTNLCTSAGSKPTHYYTSIVLILIWFDRIWIV